MRKSMFYSGNAHVRSNKVLLLLQLRTRNTAYLVWWMSAIACYAHMRRAWNIVYSGSHKNVLKWKLTRLGLKNLSYKNNTRVLYSS